jgi:phage shock protein PspC (stress-responsive transcriptional regulator)
MKRIRNGLFGGVLAGIANSTGISVVLLRVLFIIIFFGIGGITFGISSGAMILIYFLFWMFMD